MLYLDLTQVCARLRDSANDAVSAIFFTRYPHAGFRSGEAR
jgi:hypothetical protein